MEREHGKRLISFDPNVRPSQIADRGSYLTKLRHWLSLSDLIRASRSDLEYLYPNMSPEAVAKRWLKLGPSLVVITYGGDGAVGYNARAMIAAKGTPVEVVDPVGAGDAFSAGLIAWLYNHDRLDTVHLPRLSPEELERALTYATRVATITCTRMGANPPYRSELEPDS
jgi:fructokinase